MTTRQQDGVAGVREADGALVALLALAVGRVDALEEVRVFSKHSL